MSTWNLDKVETELNKSFNENLEILLLEVLKKNSFLFYSLYSRKYGIQPNFFEVSFAGKTRCDFAWLNDRSDGPEWVIIEIEKPKMRLFNQNGDPSAELNHAIEQVKSWARYFKEHPPEKSRIFGAVSIFRFILVAGSREDWSTEKAIKWRAHHNDEANIEIRSCNIFYDALEVAKNQFDELWSFEKNPISLKGSQLEKYWQEYSYMDGFRKIFK